MVMLQLASSGDPEPLAATTGTHAHNSRVNNLRPTAAFPVPIARMLEACAETNVQTEVWDTRVYKSNAALSFGIFQPYTFLDTVTSLFRFPLDVPFDFRLSTP